MSRAGLMAMTKLEVVVNGDDAAFDEVKYVVTNEDSFYHALHTRQEVRNALAARGVYSFAPMPGPSGIFMGRAVNHRSRSRSRP